MHAESKLKLQKIPLVFKKISQNEFLPNECSVALFVNNFEFFPMADIEKFASSDLMDSLSSLTASEKNPHTDWVLFISNVCFLQKL